MKILVDEMPSYASECDFVWYDLEYKCFLCSLSKDEYNRHDPTAGYYNECSLTYDSSCPYLKALTDAVK